MKVLDLFSGLGGWSQAFRDRGHEVITVDIEKKFNPDICKDIMSLESSDFKEKFDVILASPPCNCFSVASIYRHWDKRTKKPKDKETIESINLVRHTLELIEKMKPTFWILENPVGMLRKQWFLMPYERKTISQCQYGRSIMKPTDLWGRFPSSFIAKRCRPGNLDHEKASRGSKNGLQGINNSFSNLGMRGKDERAKIPYGLSLEICLACEKEIKVTENAN